MTLTEIVMDAHEAGASDIHLIQKLHPLFRIDGELRPVEDTVVTDVDCDRIALDLIGAHVDDVFKKGEIDLARSVGPVRCRINAFRQQESWSLAIRLLSDIIPKFDTLGVPSVVRGFNTFNQGLILVTGNTGSGKSTTIASLLDIVNHTENKHILTLEDPVEYLYRPDKCAVNQREVGKDTQTFASGLRAALREDPNIILVGELRDFETIEVAITAAETGHLVLGTVHANSAASTVDRLVDVFPTDRQGQIRSQLALSMRAVLSQQLLPKVGGGRVPACEVMQVDSTIQGLIREGRTPEIPGIIEATESNGNILMSKSLAMLRADGLISDKVYQSALRDALYTSYRAMVKASN